MVIAMPPKTVSPLETLSLLALLVSLMFWLWIDGNSLTSVMLWGGGASFLRFLYYFDGCIGLQNLRLYIPEVSFDQSNFQGEPKHA